MRCQGNLPSSAIGKSKKQRIRWQISFVTRRVVTVLLDLLSLPKKRIIRVRRTRFDGKFEVRHLGETDQPKKIRETQSSACLSLFWLYDVRYQWKKRCSCQKCSTSKWSVFLGVPNIPNALAATNQGPRVTRLTSSYRISFSFSIAPQMIRVNQNKTISLKSFSLMIEILPQEFELMFFRSDTKQAGIATYFTCQSCPSTNIGRRAGREIMLPRLFEPI